MIVRLGRGSLLTCLLYFVAVLFPALLVTTRIFAEASAPKVVNSLGYINRTPLTSHVTASFNSGGASTIVAFISSRPSWNGHAVSIVGTSDNVGNSWKAQEGPTQREGSTFTLLSPIYYVNAPVTPSAHRLETVLTPANVNPIQFGKLFSYSIDGIAFASPPYVAGVNIPSSGLHSVVRSWVCQSSK